MNSVFIILLAGIAAGNAAGFVFRNLNLGLLRNTVLGAVGGLTVGHLGIAVSGWEGVLPLVGLSLAGGAALPALTGALLNLADR